MAGLVRICYGAGGGNDFRGTRDPLSTDQWRGSQGAGPGGFGRMVGLVRVCYGAGGRIRFPWDSRSTEHGSVEKVARCIL